MAASRIFRILCVLAGLALVAGACSSDGSIDETAGGDVSESEPAEDDPVEAAAPDDEVETGDSETEPDATEPEADTDVDEPAVSAPTFEPGSCEFDAPLEIDVECGWVTVPQLWDDPSDPDTIRLHVATFSDAATPTDATPVVYLEGGPGGDVFGLVSFSFENQFGPILDQHPVVMFTQRGSALSQIDLECEEATELALELIERAPADGDVDLELDALQVCADRLVEEGADLGAYHSVASANDVDAIRQALGHDEWNVLGISYGTRLGQELVRTHPEGVRALILDSIQPTDPALGSLANVPTTFQGSMEQLFDGCSASAECAAANPNLEDRFRALVAQADADPFELVAADQLTGEAYDAVVDDTRLLGAVFQALYNPEAFAALPEMIGDLEEGNTDTLAALIGLGITNGPFISQGMYASVMCHDFLAELTPDSDFADGKTGDVLFDEQFNGAFEEQATQFCDVFETGSADASVTEPVTSDVPTLMLAGAYDPITPPSFATAVEPGFSNGQLAVLPHVGHGVVGDECGMDIALGFFADPSSDIDRSCIDGSNEPNWIPVSLEGVAFEPFEELLLGIEGQVPVGWDEQGPGTWVRNNSNIAHQTVLIQQAAPVPVAQFVGLLANQVGGESVPAGTFDAGVRSWEVFDIDAAAGNVRAYFFDTGNITLFVAVFGADADQAEMQAHVLPTVLGDLQAS